MWKGSWPDTTWYLQTFDHSIDRAPISLQKCHLESSESDARVIDVNMESQDNVEVMVTWVLHVKEVTQDMKELVRKGLLRIRSRRREGTGFQLVVACSQERQEQIQEMLRPSVLSCRKMGEHITAGCIFRQERHFWDDYVHAMRQRWTEAACGTRKPQMDHHRRNRYRL